MQLFGARSPETLASVVHVPDVEVADLGSLGCGDADDGLGRTGKGSPATDRKSDGGDGYARRGPDGIVENFVNCKWRPRC
jgi:hypothetical protein